MTAGEMIAMFIVRLLNWTIMIAIEEMDREREIMRELEPGVSQISIGATQHAKIPR